MLPPPQLPTLCVVYPGHQNSFFLEYNSTLMLRFMSASWLAPRPWALSILVSLCYVCQPRGLMHQSSGLLALWQVMPWLVLPLQNPHQSLELLSHTIQETLSLFQPLSWVALLRLCIPEQCYLIWQLLAIFKFKFKLLKLNEPQIQFCSNTSHTSDVQQPNVAVAALGNTDVTHFHHCMEEAVLPSRGQWTMSGDISGCHNLERACYQLMVIVGRGQR